MTYLDRPSPQKGPPWAHNTVGAAVHLALARWWSLPVCRRTAAGARRLAETGWRTEGFADDASAERWRGRAGHMVERYAAGLDPEVEPVGVERTVAVKTATLAVSPFSPLRAGPFRAETWGRLPVDVVASLIAEVVG